MTPPLDYRLYEELPEPVFLQMQRQQKEKEEAERKERHKYFDDIIKDISEKAEIRYNVSHEEK